MVSKNTGDSLAENFVDPESLMLGAPVQTEENDTPSRMVDECVIIKPSSVMEEGAEIAVSREDY